MKAMPAVAQPSRNSASVSLTPLPQRRSIAMKMSVPNGRDRKASAKIANDQSIACERLGEGEHHPREDQHRSDGIDEEVEELRAAPDDDADGDVARARLVALAPAVVDLAYATPVS